MNQFLLHVDITVDDFASNSITKVSMGTKMPPPPTPSTLPNVAPKNQIMVPTTILYPEFMSYESIVTNHPHKTYQIDATEQFYHNRRMISSRKTKKLHKAKIKS